jgi:hypothetical protein
LSAHAGPINLFSIPILLPVRQDRNLSMKNLFAALALAGLLAGCAFHAPQPPQPADTPRVPVNATPPLFKGV